MLDNDSSLLLTNGYLRPQERGNGDANQDDLSTTTNEATPEPRMILNADEKLIQMLASVSMPISATEEPGIVAPPSLIQLAGDNEVFEKPGSRSRGGMELANLVDAVNGVDIVWSPCDVDQDFGLTEVDANEGDRIRDLARFLVTCIPCEERGSQWGQDAAPMPFSL